MPAFRPRTKNEILRGMLARAIARSELEGIRINSNMYHVLGSAADEDAEQYFQMARMRDLFSLDNATGSDLDERALEMQTDTDLSRRTANRATVSLLFSRQGTTGTIPINEGSLGAASDADGQIKFVTTAAGSIPDGSSQSGLIPAIAQVAGARGNVDKNQIIRMVSRIPGVTAVTNPSAAENGRSRESDPDYRARLRLHVQSMSRGTTYALQSTAASTSLSDGQQVLFAKVVEPLANVNYIFVYIDDGTGDTDKYDSSLLLSPETLVLSATGTEDRLNLAQWPVRDDGSFELRYDGIAQVRGTDYLLEASTGDIEIINPPAAAQAVTSAYRFYTDLVGEVQKLINGDPDDRVNYPGVRAGGIFTRVLPATRVLQTVTGQLSVLDGYVLSDIITNVTNAIQQYVNSLNIGEPVLVARIYQVVMGVDGVRNFALTALTGSTPPTDQVVISKQVARILSGSISIV